MGLEFDYIIIGSGPAGTIMAKMLSDNKKNSVLLLEAGGNHDQNDAIKNSEHAFELEEKYYPQFFWQGLGIPQPGVDGHSFEWTTGRLLGGGSSINGEQYVRPTAGVLNEWESLLGPRWSYDKAVEFFKKIENYNGATTNPPARGEQGPIDIRLVEESPVAEQLVEAIEKATLIPKILDYNDPNTPMGPFISWQLYQNPNGERESASTAFLSDIMNEKGKGVNGRKLVVYWNTTALRILFDDQCAEGVEFLRAGEYVKAKARKKVIVSAGINSAQLLMLSGIGPASPLKSVGIPVIYDNENVGKKLTNHTLNFAVFSKNHPPIQVKHGETDPNALYAGGAFLPDPAPGADQSRRGVQLVGFDSEESLSIAIIYLHPKSTGSIVIQSKDPLQIPLADEGFLANPDDLEAIKNIYKTYIKPIAEKLMAMDPTYELVSPTLDIINDDHELEHFIKEDFGHNHHHQGSLRMGPLEAGGVVDSRGYVYGVKNLIVADDSIVPYVVDGNTSAPAYFIGYTIANYLLSR